METKKKTKRIGIDARFYGYIGKGLGRYTQKLIENLEKIESEEKNEIEYYIFLRKENFDEYKPKNKNFHKVLANYQWYTISEQINMPRLLNKYDLDLVHFPHFNIPILYFRPFVATIHDLILLNFPTVRGTTLSPIFYRLKFLAYKLVIGLGVMRAKKIFAVSEFTKKDILNQYSSLDENKLVVTYEACDSKNAENKLKKEGVNGIFEKFGLFDKKCGIIKPYILYVGNAYPHKNLERLLTAFGRVLDENEDLHLVLIGKNDYFYERLRDLVKHKNIKNVIFAGFVNDDELGVFYQNAKFYVFPSLYEGFGLPPLEAMSNGVPVASSDHNCMKEILEDGAYYFDAKDEKSIADAMIEMNNNAELREELIGKGFEKIKKYSWGKMATDTLSIYKKIL